jgi:hypothetical protein
MLRRLEAHLSIPVATAQSAMKLPNTALRVFFGNLSVTLSFRLPSQHGSKVRSPGCTFVQVVNRARGDAG